LITAGPTREYLDPVRFISNSSTGEMGYALAREAKRLGHEVTLVSGPTALAAPKGMECISITSAEDLKNAIMSCWPKTDLLIMSAAVSDYKPSRLATQKMAKSKTGFKLFLKPNPDILRYFGKRKGKRLIVGFSLDTQDVERKAVRKLNQKNLDFIAANWFSRNNNPFGKNRFSMLLLGRRGFRKKYANVSKMEAAKVILKEVIS